MEKQKQTENLGFGHWLKHSAMAKLLFMAILTGLLWIPLGLTRDLIDERASRQQQVIGEINQKWGRDVLTYGPILKVPYMHQVTTTKQKNTSSPTYTESDFIYLFPDELKMEAEIDVKAKKYGIYHASVYQNKTQYTGSFSETALKKYETNWSKMDWSRVQVVFGISNLKGVNEQIVIAIGDEEFPLTAQGNNPGGAASLFYLETERIDLSQSSKDAVSFEMGLGVNGSRRLGFIPIGKTTETQLKSNWSTANYFGAFLPQETEKVSDKVINTQWRVLDINRPFAQSYLGVLPNLTQHTFGVNFIAPVNEYLKNERTSKYGLLVIGLTFLVFFLIQMVSNLNVHPFQYLLIGFALVLFYVLLLSLSEHLGFSRAYFIAGLAIVGMISLYAKSLFSHWKLPSFIALSLGSLYAFLFIIIQMESYSLLVGSIGVFIILSVVMYVSRKINWNQK